MLAHIQAYRPIKKAPITFVHFIKINKQNPAGALFYVSDDHKQMHIGRVWNFDEECVPNFYSESHNDGG